MGKKRCAYRWCTRQWTFGETKYCSRRCREYAENGGPVLPMATRPAFGQATCVYCGVDCGHSQWTCNSEDCAKSHQLYSLAYGSTDGRLDRVRYSDIVRKANGVCEICDESLQGRTEVDHIVPRQRGGDHTLANVRLTHWHCNTAKGARTA